MALISAIFAIPSYGIDNPSISKPTKMSTYSIGGKYTQKGKRHKSQKSRSNRRKAKAKR